ncbi:MAG: hypothetical protein JXB33_10400 [Clostridia bacterium]|nr:hypothetical protein [Clostridia bacterium]
MKKTTAVFLCAALILAVFASSPASAASDRDERIIPVFTQMSVLPAQILPGDQVAVTFTTGKRGSVWVLGELTGLTDPSTVLDSENGVYVTTAYLDTSVRGELSVRYEIRMPAGRSGIVFSGIYEAKVSVGSGDTIYWNQDFSENADGWTSDGSYGVVEWSAGTAVFQSGSSSGPYSRFDGYHNEWPGEWFAQIDVFLSPGDLAPGEGFDYSVAANSVTGALLRDFVFHFAKDESTGTLLAAASNSYSPAVRDDIETLPNHAAITESGWYTLQHRFHDAGGYLAVEMKILDSGGNPVFCETLSNPMDTIPGTTGGNRYAWFTLISISNGIEVDNFCRYSVL